MKNVILVAQDRNVITNNERKRIIERILADGMYKIILLIINSAEKKEDYLVFEGVKQVITTLELEYMESMSGLSYAEITRHRKYQSDIETMAYRMFGDYQMSGYYYYEALSFWIRFFNENKVDVIIHTNPYHGYMYDCCDIVARKRGIKSFHMNPVGYNHTFTVYTDYQIIPVKRSEIKKVEYLLQSGFDKTELAPSVENKCLVRSLLYRIGGNLLEDFATRLVRWNWSPRAYARKRAKIYWSEKFFGYMKLKCVRRYMEAISCTPNFDEKYICYFLHFEPEASIQVSTILPNQLVIIKMLSETLPEGWTLYVKEHPAQFNVNNDTGYYFMFDAPLFKTKKFYQKINSFDNVKIVKQKVPSKELIDNSQGVASILGTVFLESVLKKKPVLVFSDLSPVAHMEDAFYIHSFNECKNAIKRIEEGFQPNYLDANEVIGKYVFKGEHMADNIIDIIKNEC